MAVGFTPKFEQDISLADLTQEQAVALLYEVAGHLKWEVSDVTESGIIAYTNKGMFSFNAKITIKIEEGIAHLKSESTGSEMMDWGKNKKMLAGFVAALDELKQATTTAELDTKYQELTDNNVIAAEDVLKLPPETTEEKIRSVFAIFAPTQGFFVTPLLIDINILLFIIMVASGVSIMEPDNASLLKWGANFRAVTMEGEWWRLITSAFLHIGVIHLLMNMYALLYIGILLEPYLGKARFISAYMLAGVAASVTSLWWHDLTISAGASGAIFGMYGVFLAMLTGNFIEKAARKSLMVSIGLFVGYNLLYGMKGGIDNAAHIGGLVSGLIIGFVYLPSLKKPEANGLKYITIAVLTVLIVVSSVVVYNNTSNDIGKYDAKIKEFIANEKLALEVFNLPKDSPNDKYLSALQEHGIYYWEQNIKIIDELEGLKLPDDIKKRNRLLKEYCALRIKSYELIYKAIKEDTDDYKDQIAEYNKQIEKVINNIDEHSKEVEER